jgi:ATP-dependent Clp protease ATP-binding subunit ClpA
VTGKPVPNQEFQKAITNAIEEAGLLHSMAAKPEHLLLGLLRDEHTLASKLLREAGLDYAAVRKQLEGD